MSMHGFLSFLGGKKGRLRASRSVVPRDCTATDRQADSTRVTSAEACEICKNLKAAFGHDDDDGHGRGEVTIAIRREIWENAKDPDLECRYCCFLRDAAACLDLPDADLDSMTVHLAPYAPLVISMREKPASGNRKAYLIVCASRGISSLSANLQEFRDQNLYLGSEACIDFIQSQLVQCLQGDRSGHHCCDTWGNERESFWPSRLIDVSDDRVRLRLFPDSHSEKTKYCTLSYRWGSAGLNLKTTTGNIDRMSAGIEWDTLPALHRDAITVTRWLGCDYLWIDSLCILQDSEKDWNHEAGFMAEYYEHSYLTIVAAACESAAQSFLVPRDQADLLSGRTCVPFKNDDGTVADITVRRVPHELGSHMTGHLPLSKRGWAFQENVLSPVSDMFANMTAFRQVTLTTLGIEDLTSSKRLLHFTASEIIYECRDRTVFENGAVIRDQLGLASRYVPHTTETTVSSEEEMQDRSWKRLVTEYSRRHLTFDSDRLPAISGIESSISRSFVTSYLNGTIERWLRSDLLWISQWDLSLSGGPAHYQTAAMKLPSWSWASVTGPINYCVVSSQDLEDFGFQVVKSPFPQNYYYDPPLDKGVHVAINMKGILFESTIVYTPQSAHTLNQHPTITLLRSPWTRRMLVRLPQSPADSYLVPHIIEDYYGQTLCTARRAVQGEEPSNQVFHAEALLLYVGSKKETKDGEYSRKSPKPRYLRMCFFLVLVPFVQVSGKAGYQRIGAFMLDMINNKPLSKRAKMVEFELW